MNDDIHSLTVSNDRHDVEKKYAVEKLESKNSSLQIVTNQDFGFVCSRFYTLGF